MDATAVVAQPATPAASGDAVAAFHARLGADGILYAQLRGDHVWVQRSELRKLRALDYVLTLETTKAGAG